MKIEFAVPTNPKKIAQLMQYVDENQITLSIEGNAGTAEVPDIDAFTRWLHDNDFEGEFEKEIAEANYQEVCFTANPDNLKDVIDFAQKHRTVVLFSINMPEKAIGDFQKLLKQNKGEVII